MKSNKRMRVAMYYSNKDVRIEEMEIPNIGDYEVLVRVQASGICGTDVMEWYRREKVPLVLGHEVSGVIAEVGDGVEGFKVGDRVVCGHHVSCGSCKFCLSGHPTVCQTLRTTNFYPGGFSEFIRLPEINVKKGIFLLPDSISFEEGTFVEPLGCVLRGQRLINLKKGQSVLVIGSGISGLLHIKLAKSLGAEPIVAIDIVDFRLKKAKEVGADFVIDAEEDVPNFICKINNGDLSDIVILCSGAKGAVIQALRAIERGGTVLFFACTEEGLTVPISINELFWRNEITLTSSYAASPEEYKEALDLIASRKIRVNDLITHRLSLDEAQLGFRLVAEAKESIKVIIKP